MLFPIGVWCNTDNPSVRALRVETSPKIDGFVDEGIWQLADIASNFTQNDPQEGAEASQRTEVMFLYDDHALYVGAICYDSDPDKILKQLGNRDDGLNADYFRIAIDPYNQQTDAFNFGVYASGVQSDNRFSDWRFDAVWTSAVQITDFGWTVEMKIPYSAFRFPAEEVQSWALQITRDIRRDREFVQWALTRKGEDNFMQYWGTLDGIENIEPPVRLSITPYLTFYNEYYSNRLDKDQNDYNYKIAGGADIKYGVNESFTLDATLLPDFSQVQSDNEVKNLSAFEVIFSEQRSFFQEGIDLFQKGNLFYTRRIGGFPVGYGRAFDSLGETESVIENPTSARLMNGLKFSGRTSNGLGLGIFNAVTNNSKAIIYDSASNSEREVITDPITNYSIVVLDQQLKNNNSFYFINTNTTRAKGFYDANVAASGFGLYDKQSRYRFEGRVAVSTLFGMGNDSISAGVDYGASFEKASGTWQWGVWTEGTTAKFDKNDMGVVFRTDVMQHGAWGGYNIYNPVWRIRWFYSNLNLFVSQRMSDGLLLDYQWSASFDALFDKRFLVVWTGYSMDLMAERDLFEARQPDQIFRSPKNQEVWVGFSTDYRHKLAADGNFGMNHSKTYGQNWTYYGFIQPIYRASDRLDFRHYLRISVSENNVGFADFDESGNSIFGSRDLMTVENIFTTRYIFKNNLSLSFRARHYWQKGNYLQYFSLQDDGYLKENNDYSGNNNFNFNAFNIDLVFEWEFAPGSMFSIVYKNAILNDNSVVAENWFANWSEVFGEDQLNSISVRFLYFFDWVYLQKKKQN